MQDFAYIVRDSVIPYISSNAKHVLDHLASREGENGVAWPSAQTIADCTNISLRGVQRAIRSLLDHRLIVCVSGKLTGKSNRYKVTLPAALIQTYADNYPQKHIRVKDFATSEVCHADAPPIRHADTPTVGQGDARGATGDAAGVRHPDGRSKTLLIENKTTNIQKDVSQSVSLCHPPIVTTHTPPKSGRVCLDNGAVTKSTPPDGCVRRLPSGRFSVDRTYAAKTCWEVGASNEQAYKFWRYNQTRGWPLLATMELVDVARRWRDRWQREHPDAYQHEQDIRREAKERRERRALEAAYAAQLALDTPTEGGTSR